MPAILNTHKKENKSPKSTRIIPNSVHWMTPFKLLPNTFLQKGQMALHKYQKSKLKNIWIGTNVAAAIQAENDDVRI